LRLKTNKTSTKRLGSKIKNQKNKDWSWNVNNQESQAMIHGVGEREEWEKKAPQHQTRALKEKWHDHASNDMIKKYV
jgi:hypothetical protein